MHWYSYVVFVFVFVGVVILAGWYWQSSGKEVADQKEAEQYGDES